MTRIRWIRGGLLVATLALGACGNHDAKAPSQVLARVNDAEITVLQLNGVLASQPLAQNNAAMKQALLDQLIEQELLVQKAAALKLDRDPEVMQAIEQSRRQILASAVVQREVGKIGNPSQADVDAFYSKNPGLFAQRKIYDFAVFQLARADLTAALQTELERSGNPDQTQTLLNGRQVKFQVRMTRMPAEQLPLELLPKIEAMKTGDVAELPQAEQVTLLQLVHAEPAAVDAKQAGPAIVNYLRSQRGQAEALARMAALKAAAKIVYVKRFGASASAPVAAAAKDSSLNNGLKGLQ